MIGDLVAPHAAKILAEVAAQPIVAKSPLIVSASPVPNGALLRIAGEKLEEVDREIQRCLGFVPELLQDDPWRRKW